MEQNKKLKKWLYVSFSILILILLISAVFIIIDAGKSATLEILVAPISADIKIDGKSYKNGTHKFEPGEINVVIEKEGFVSESRVLILEENSVTKLYTYLMAKDGSFDWYLEHEDDMMILNTIGDAEANAESAAYLQRYPIVSVLPIIYANYDEKWDYTEFRIDGGEFDGCSSSFCLKITDTTGNNQQNALRLIEESGYNPSDYEILYEYKPIVPL